MNAGGLVPFVKVGREVHIFDGATYSLKVTWLHRGFSFEYHTPRIPRSARRVRERERS